MEMKVKREEREIGDDERVLNKITRREGPVRIWEI